MYQVLFLLFILKKSKELTKVICNNEKEKLDRLGLKNDLSDWRCYEISNIPGKIIKIKLLLDFLKLLNIFFCYVIYLGLIFISNPFTPCGQKYWMKRCIVDYTKKPNRLNIDAHHCLDVEEDWWTTVNKLVVN